MENPTQEQIIAIKNIMATNKKNLIIDREWAKQQGLSDAEITEAEYIEWASMLTLKELAKHLASLPEGAYIPDEILRWQIWL
jgi:hypothetical protein